MLGKRSADNARRFMLDVASRLTFPKPHTSATLKATRNRRLQAGHANLDRRLRRPIPKRLTWRLVPTSEYGTIIKEYPQREHDLHPLGNGRHEADGHRRNIGDRELHTISTSATSNG